MAASQELTGDTNPELGLAKRISLSKGCYLGQETMAKLAASVGEAAAAQLEQHSGDQYRYKPHAAVSVVSPPAWR